MSDITSYATATIARQLPGIQDAVIERNETLKMLKKKGRMKYGLGGDSIKWRVYASQPSIFGSTSDWGVRNAQTIQPYVTAEVRWAQYDGMLIENDFQLQRNKNADQNVKLFDQLMEDLAVFKQAAITRIGQHTYNGTGTTYTGDLGTSISGLVDIVSATGTYAGITRSGNTYWQSQTGTVTNAELDSDGDNVPNLLEGMRTLWLACSTGVGPSEDHVSDQLATDKATPDFIVTTSSVYANFDNVMYQNQRYTNGASKDPQGNLTFYGVPIMWDSFCPSTKMYFLNSQYLSFDCCGKQMIEQPEELQGVPVVNQNARVWKLLGQFQLYSKNPKYHGVLTVS